MNIARVAAGVLAVAMMLSPADALARKKQKKYEKKVVTIEQSITAERTPVPVTITDAAAQLYGEWAMTTLRKKPVVTRERAYIYLDFDNHRVYGNNGCNSLNGEFRLQGADISFRDMTTTDGTCHSGTGERTIMKALAEAAHFQLAIIDQIEELTLTNAKGQQLMTLKRQNLDFLNGAWLVSKAGDDDVAQQNVRLVIDATLRTLHGNTGCNIINGILTIDPEKELAVQFEDLHSHGNGCEAIAVETAVLVALEQTERCRRLDDGAVELADGKGNVTMVLTPITLRR